jgi:hypothetical protein
MTAHGTDRRAFVATVATGMLLVRSRVFAQSPAPPPPAAILSARPRRIGFLTPSAVSPRGIMPDMRQ